MEHRSKDIQVVYDAQLPKFRLLVVAEHLVPSKPGRSPKPVPCGPNWPSSKSACPSACGSGAKGMNSDVAGAKESPWYHNSDVCSIKMTCMINSYVLSSKSCQWNWKFEDSTELIATITRHNKWWWFFRYVFYVHPEKFGEENHPFWRAYFSQLGWFNHKLQGGPLPVTNGVIYPSYRYL